MKSCFLESRKWTEAGTRRRRQDNGRREEWRGERRERRGKSDAKNRADD